MCLLQVNIICDEFQSAPAAASPSSKSAANQWSLGGEAIFARCLDALEAKGDAEEGKRVRVKQPKPRVKSKIAAAGARAGAVARLRL